jgi:hypothetical protein
VTFAAVVLLAARRRLQALGRLAVAAVAAAIAAGPFIVELVRWLGAGIGGGSMVLNVAGFAPAWAVLLHFGVFLVPLTALAVVVAGRRRPAWTAVAVAVAAVGGPLLLIPAASLLAGKGLPAPDIWLDLWFPFADAAEVLQHLSLAAGPAGPGAWLLTFPAATFMLAVAGLAAIARWQSRTPAKRLGWSLVLTASATAAAVEWITMIDRMNTVFKVYNTLWVILALASTLFLLRAEGRRRRVLAAIAVPLILLGIGTVPLTVAQAWANPRIASPRPTLDGQAFLETEREQTWRIVRYLRATAEPGEVVAEAAGSSYGPFSRITMHTGLPIVVGWQWHLQQRGQPIAEIRGRFDDLETLYSDGTPQQRRAVLERYRVRWLVVGDLERRTYSIGADQRPFERVPGVVAALWDDRGQPLVYHVLTPDRATGAAEGRAAHSADLPDDVIPLGTVPAPPQPRVRSLSVHGSQGGVLVLADGSVARTNRDGQLQRVAPAPCNVSAATQHGTELWIVCRDGQLLHSEDAVRWRSGGRLDGATGLAALDRLWAWGPGGAWSSREGRRWQRRLSAAVDHLAAGPNAVVLLTADGALSVLEGSDPPQAPIAVRRIAWSADALWALDDGGSLWRSGGGVLPWRQPYPELAGLETIAGDGSRLWLVLADGVLGEIEPPPLVSPFRTSESAALGSFKEPRAIAVAPEGWLAVADTRHYRVQFLKADGSPLGSFGSEGSGLGELEDPAGVAVSADGRVAVADTWNGRVQILEPDGSVSLVDATLYGPRAVLWSPDGELLVADTGNSRLLRCPPGALRAELLADTGGRPMGMAWTRGHLAVAVPDREAVLVLDSNGSEIATATLAAWSEPDAQEAYLAARGDGSLLASAPGPGELWLVDPWSDDPPRRLVSGLEGLTGVAVLADGSAIGALTWEHRLVRLRVGLPE